MKEGALLLVISLVGCFDTTQRRPDAAVVPTDAPYSCGADLVGRWRLDFEAECERSPEIIEGLPYPDSEVDCEAEGCGPGNCLVQSVAPPLCQRVVRFAYPCLVARGTAVEVVAQVVSESRVDISTVLTLDTTQVRCSYTATRVP